MDEEERRQDAKELLALELPIPVTFDKIHKKVDREKEEYLANKKDGNIRRKKEEDILEKVSAHVLNNPPCRRLFKAAYAEEKAQELYPAERDVHGLALYGGYKIKTEPCPYEAHISVIWGCSFSGAEAFSQCGFVEAVCLVPYDFAVDSVICVMFGTL